MNANSNTPKPEITEILRALGGGNREMLDALLPLVYDELHRQAHRHLRGERAGHTLQTTALINEAYLKLIEQKNAGWESRTHFFAIAASLMRRILIDYARTKKRIKRGGADLGDYVPLDENLLIAADESNLDLLDLDAALDRLAEMDEQQSKIVELKYFSGLSIEETAQALGISPATVKRDWNMAKAWLYRELGGATNL